MKGRRRIYFRSRILVTAKLQALPSASVTRAGSVFSENRYSSERRGQGITESF